MSFSLRRLPTLLLAIIALPIYLFAQSTVQTAKPARGAISGRITIKGKGISSIVVGLRKVDRSARFNPEPHLRTVTDQDGHYRIANLAAGSYEVIPSLPAFVVVGSIYGKTKSVNVAEDENVDDIDFSLVRGGVITGRVTDADGRPVIQQGIQLYRVETVEQAGQQRPLSHANASVTDDRGVYRMYGIVAGRYKVSAGKGENAFAAFTGSAPPGRSIYKQVFHPDVIDHVKATTIEVTEGSEANNVDIVVGRALQTYSASGRVVDENSIPVPNLRFGLQRSAGQRMEFVSTMALSDSKGEFVVEGLIPGKYGIYLMPSQGEDLRVPPFTFDIVDQDLTGLTLKLTKGASLSGIVVLETEDKTAFEKLTKLQVRAFAMMGTGFGGTSSSPIAPDGSFRLGSLPAGNIQVLLSSMTGETPPGFNIVRIERDGVVLPRHIETKDGENITGLRVVVAYGTATIRGMVKLANGVLPEGGFIIVRLTKQGEMNAFGRPWQTDARGQFLIEGVAPGFYELSAQVLTSNGQGAKSAKREVNVSEGGATEVLITVDMSAPTPKP